MTNAEKQAYIKAPYIGYWSCFGGVEVKEIQYGIDDHMVVVDNAWYGSNKGVHRVMIHYGTRDYIKLSGTRLYLDECIRA